MRVWVALLGPVGFRGSRKTILGGGGGLDARNRCLDLFKQDMLQEPLLDNEGVHENQRANNINPRSGAAGARAGARRQRATWVQ